MHHYTNYDIIGFMEAFFLMFLTGITGSIDGLVHKNAVGAFGARYHGRGAVIYGIFMLITTMIWLAADIFIGVLAFRHFQVAWIPVLLKVIVLAPFTNWLFLLWDAGLIWYLVYWYKAKGHFGEMLVPGVYYRKERVIQHVQESLHQKTIPEMTEQDILTVKGIVDQHTSWFQSGPPKKYIVNGKLQVENIMESLRKKEWYQDRGESFDGAAQAIIEVYVETWNRAVDRALVRRIRKWVEAKRQNQKTPM